MWDKINTYLHINCIKKKTKRHAMLLTHLLIHWNSIIAKNWLYLQLGYNYLFQREY
jgi:hypothetical protein